MKERRREIRTERTGKPPIHLTVDLELFEHTFAYQRLQDAPGINNIGLEGVDFLLDLLREKGITITFFVVAEMAERYSALVRKIEEQGHEIASHSTTHTSQDKDILRQAKESKRILENIIKGEVVGFRAPALNISKQNVGRLEEFGYTYDSSLTPSIKIPGWYGGRRTKLSLQEELSGYELKRVQEIPPSVNIYLRTPISGFWLRSFGFEYLRWSLNSLFKREISPVFYIHPWELVDLPKLKDIPTRVYFRTGRQFRNKLRDHLLDSDRYNFKPIRESIAYE